ncbi:MAG: COX15/CtaA family protein [Anaerolineae bacterium]|nr:COX15/CtaA family protein [Phycisphaerae bacterium]
MSDTRYSPTLHRLALLTAIATFPLIFMGGLVTSHGAGMSVPDWPNSYGYNMFTFPPSKWVGGIFYEHTHRLMGTVVGMLSIALTIAAWKLESRRWVRWLTTIVLGAVILQGVLGGLRVVFVNLDLAIVHACFAQAFFCLASIVAVVTSRRWIEAPDLSRATDGTRGRRLTTLAAACVFAVFAQLVIGAVMRHEKAGLAIPDLPLAYGQLVPPTSANGLNTINQQRAWTYHLDPVTLGNLWLNFAHRVGAVVVSILLIGLIALALAKFRSNQWLLRPALALIALLLLQITLGVLTVLMRKPADIASAHVATGALVLATTVVFTVRAMRCYSLSFRTVSSTTCSEAKFGFDLATA